MNLALQPFKLLIITISRLSHIQKKIETFLSISLICTKKQVKGITETIEYFADTTCKSRFLHHVSVFMN